MKFPTLEHTTMIPRKIFVSLFLFANQAFATAEPLADLQVGQPANVRKLIDRIFYCHHFAGEEPYDAARKREIASAWKRLKCDRLEKDEAAVRKRYAKQPGVLKAIQKTKDLAEGR